MLSGTDAGGAARWPGLADIAVPAVLALGQLGGTLLFNGVLGDPLDRRQWILVWAGVLAGAAALVWRRVAPLRVLAATTAVGGACALAIHDAEVLVGGVAEVVALFSVAVRRSGRVAVVSTLASWAVVFLSFLPVRSGLGDALVTEFFNGTQLFVVTALGQLRRQRHAHRRTLAERLAAGDAERRAAAEAERRRLAQDLHDVAGHHLSAIAVHSAAAARVPDPGVARAALTAAADTGRDVQDALAHLVDLVAADTAEGRLDRLLPPLCHGLTRLGVPVALTLEGRARRVRPEVVTAAYRIVQEALTNALRYAPGASVTVEVRYASGAVRIAVANTAPTGSGTGGGLGGGRGIAGMRERAEGVDGTLTAGPEPGGGWAVRADLPLAAPRRGPGWPEVVDGTTVFFCAVLPLLLSFVPPEPMAGGWPVAARAATVVALVARALPLWWRRRAPWRAFAALAAVDLLWTATAGVVSQTAFAVLVVGSPASLVAVYAVARYAAGRTWPAPFLGAVPWAAGLTTAIAIDPHHHAGDLTFGVLAGGGGALLLLLPFWAWGRTVALRVHRFESRALELMAARAGEAALAERHRVAIGLRGTVLDHTSRLVSTAESGLTDDADVPRTLTAVAGHARAALTEMRRLLASLEN
ncbi:histidine kinase [Actinomadura rayongensis]|uniref:histidine kinase n=1 Tax=Actinomadura rayongensis TaxID=1429076 RepID=A0A6I4W0P5_9ACTN|nr:hypothetical protein [Actinomadura rayongensis]